MDWTKQSIEFLHFIFHEIQADDQKITLNMNIHDYIFTAITEFVKILDYMVIKASINFNAVNLRSIK